MNAILYSRDLENILDGGILQYVKKLIKYEAKEDSVIVLKIL